jgi:hypothetical protein
MKNSTLHFKIFYLVIFLVWHMPFYSISQNSVKQVVIRPQEIDDVLLNPGMGFMTFQRFNGDTLNPGIGWTEGYPIEYQTFNGDITNKNYPSTTIAYWRVCWKFMEPEMKNYRWDMLDKALEVARSRGQTLIFRIAPYQGSVDVPDWYREIVGPQMKWENSDKWKIDHEDPRYVEYFGGMIRSLGERYDGHPDLEAVDLSIVGSCGEGGGLHTLSKITREALIDAYTESFRKTPLITLLTRGTEANMYANSKIHVGWRVDCIGDLGFWATEERDWNHMFDYYPIQMIKSNFQDSWKHSPVSFEICGTFLRWRDREGYGREEVKYIFDQTLKWHISSFNAKSSPVPEEWEDLVEDWLKKMGYRYVLRTFSYPEEVHRNGKLSYASWWENKGVAPC